jgi:hypothetical protein
VSNPTPIQTNLVTSEQAYRNFIDACRSLKTRYLYKKSLDYFMSYLRIPLGEYNKLIEVDSRITQADHRTRGNRFATKKLTHKRRLITGPEILGIISENQGPSGFILASPFVSKKLVFSSS